MTFTQVYNLVNDATKEVLGESAILNEDLSNVVDIGDAIENVGGYDKYVKTLVNHIGRVIFVDRVYRGRIPSIMLDGWEFGSIMEKIHCELPDAQENESWELEDGAEYNPNIFKSPKVEAKFFNKRITFEIQMSFTEKQVKMSFSNASQLSAFVAMIYTAVENSLTIKIDALIMRTLDNFIGMVAHNNDTNTYVNLLSLYNQLLDTPITVDECLTNPDFIRFAVLTIGLYQDRLAGFSTLFNIGGKERFTPADALKMVYLSNFDKAAKVYLYDGNGQFKDENIKLPTADVVSYWQGSGTTFDFDDVSKVDIKTAQGDSVQVTGVLAVMFDKNALGVTNLDRRVTSAYNAKGEFYNNFYKFDAGYFNDTNENFVVFYVGE